MENEEAVNRGGSDHVWGTMPEDSVGKLFLTSGNLTPALKANIRKIRKKKIDFETPSGGAPSLSRSGKGRRGGEKKTSVFPIGI